MKRLISAVLLTAVSLVLLASVASASTKASRQIMFQRTDLYATLAALDPAAKVNVNSGTTAGTLDSLYASGIAKFDTTAWFSTRDIVRPSTSAADSSTFVTLHVYDAGLATVTLGKTSATAESLYVKCQVSPDEVTWTDLPILSGHAPVANAWTLQTTVNAAVQSALNTSATGISAKSWAIKWGSTSYHNADALLAYPYARFIVSGSRTLNHSFKATLYYWKD